jgi:hypothetical protein
MVNMSVTSVQAFLQKKWYVSSAKKMKSEEIDLWIVSFIYKLTNGDECPQCVVCCEVLINSSLSSRILCRHLTLHASVASKPLEFFE